MYAAVTARAKGMKVLCLSGKDGGKLAAWRLMTHGEFGGTWLSDYIPNRLEDSDSEQPVEDAPEMCQ